MVGKVLQLSRELWGGTVLEDEPKVIGGFKPFEKSHDVGMGQRVEKRNLVVAVMIIVEDVHAGNAPRAACAAAQSCQRTSARDTLTRYYTVLYSAATADVIINDASSLTTKLTGITTKYAHIHIIGFQHVCI